MSRGLILTVEICLLLAAQPAARAQVPFDSWLVRNSGTATDLAMVNFGDNQFVIVGLQGTILTSSNGVTWTRRTSPTASDIYSVAYGGGQWVAVGPSGLIMTSSNAVNWTMRTTVASALYNVTYGNGRFVTVGSAPGSPNSDVFTSTNGINWTSTILSGVVLSGVTHANNLFVTVGGHAICDFFGCVAYPDIYTSTSGLPPWANRGPAGTGFSLVDVTYGSNTFVTVGTDGAIMTSPSGSGWTRRSSPVSSGLNSVAFGLEHFISVGESGVILSSTNAINWVRRTSPVSTQLYEVTYGQGTFVIVGVGGRILQSQVPRPRLRLMSASSGSATVSWTPADVPGFVLQYSESLALTNWVNVSGSENPVTVPSSGVRFYRLFRP